MITNGERGEERMICRGLWHPGFKGLIEATGVNAGALHSRCPGKDDLGLAGLDRACERFLDFVRQSLAGEAPGDRVQAFFPPALRGNTFRGLSGGWSVRGKTAREMFDSDGGRCYIHLVECGLAA